MKVKTPLLILFLAQVGIAQNLKFTLSGKVFESRSKTLVAGATLKLVSSDGSIVETKTDSFGNYFFDATKIKANTSYVASATGFDVKTKQFPEGLLGNPKYKFSTKDSVSSISFIKDFYLIQVYACDFIIPNILFEKNTAELQAVFKDSLNVVVKIMISNPNIVMEIGGNARTDEKNADSLALKRAETVINYMVT